MIRTYTELMQLEAFEDRYKYLQLKGVVGESTFGFDRYLNQRFYRSREWRSLRHRIIVRDNGCDLGIRDREIHQGLYIHHMQPMTIEDIEQGNPDILNAEYLITVSHDTHNAIHYGDEKLLPRKFVERTPGDTRLW